MKIRQARRVAQLAAVRRPESQVIDSCRWLEGDSGGVRSGIRSASWSYGADCGDPVVRGDGDSPWTGAVWPL